MMTKEKRRCQNWAPVCLIDKTEIPIKARKHFQVQREQHENISLINALIEKREWNEMN